MSDRGLSRCSPGLEGESGFLFIYVLMQELHPMYIFTCISQLPLLIGSCSPSLFPADRPLTVTRLTGGLA